MVRHYLARAHLLLLVESVYGELGEGRTARFKLAFLLSLR